MTVHRIKAFTSFLLLPIAALLLTLQACSSEDIAPPRSAEVLFESGMLKFNDEDYQEAYDEFRLLTLQYQGSTLADDAQFTMGECKFRRGEYLLAAYEYEILIRTMPTSEFVANARFNRAMCFSRLSPRSYLDQENTRKAIDEFQTFLEYHPTDPRAPEAEAKINFVEKKTARLDEKILLFGKKLQPRSAKRYTGLTFSRLLLRNKTPSTGLNKNASRKRMPSTVVIAPAIEPSIQVAR